MGVEVGAVGDGRGRGVEISGEGIVLGDLFLGFDDGGHEGVFAESEAGVDGNEGGKIGGFEIGAEGLNEGGEVLGVGFGILGVGVAFALDPEEGGWAKGEISRFCGLGGALELGEEGGVAGVFLRAFFGVPVLWDAGAAEGDLEDGEFALGVDFEEVAGEADFGSEATFGLGEVSVLAGSRFFRSRLAEWLGGEGEPGV